MTGTSMLGIFKTSNSDNDSEDRPFDCGDNISSWDDNASFAAIEETRGESQE
jgi:hypothetical protein